MSRDLQKLDTRRHRDKLKETYQLYYANRSETVAHQMMRELNEKVERDAASRAGANSATK